MDLPAAQETPEWEASKENFQPRRGGRHADALTDSSTVIKSKEIDQAREAFRRSIVDYAGSDPLDPWLKYVSWTQRTFSTDASRGGLVSLLEKATRTFAEDARYRDDVRYLKAWLLYADALSDATDAFAFMRSRGIGAKHALLYLAWSAHQEKRGRHDEARRALEKGVEAEAAPLDRLKKALEAFDARMERRKARDRGAKGTKGQNTQGGGWAEAAAPTARLGLGGRPAGALAGAAAAASHAAYDQENGQGAAGAGRRTLGLGAAASAASRQARMLAPRAPAPAPDSSADAPSSFAIYEDDDSPSSPAASVPFPSVDRLTGTCQAGAAGEPGEGSPARGWRSGLPSAAVARKENDRRPEQWSESGGLYDGAGGGGVRRERAGGAAAAALPATGRALGGGRTLGGSRTLGGGRTLGGASLGGARALGSAAEAALPPLLDIPVDPELSDAAAAAAARRRLAPAPRADGRAALGRRDRPDGAVARAPDVVRVEEEPGDAERRQKEREERENEEREREERKEREREEKEARERAREALERSGGAMPPGSEFGSPAAHPALAAPSSAFAGYQDATVTITTARAFDAVAGAFVGELGLEHGLEQPEDATVTVTFSAAMQDVNALFGGGLGIEDDVAVARAPGGPGSRAQAGGAAPGASGSGRACPGPGRLLSGTHPGALGTRNDDDDDDDVILADEDDEESGDMLMDDDGMLPDASSQNPFAFEIREDTQMLGDLPASQGGATQRVAFEIREDTHVLDAQAAIDLQAELREGFGGDAGEPAGRTATQPGAAAGGFPGRKRRGLGPRPVEGGEN